jgi:hypothetical protein
MPGRRWSSPEMSIRKTRPTGRVPQRGSWSNGRQGGRRDGDGQSARSSRKPVRKARRPVACDWVQNARASETQSLFLRLAHARRFTEAMRARVRRVAGATSSGSVRSSATNRRKPSAVSTSYHVGAVDALNPSPDARSSVCAKTTSVLHVIGAWRPQRVARSGQAKCTPQSRGPQSIADTIRLRPRGAPLRIFRGRHQPTRGRPRRPRSENARLALASRCFDMEPLQS